jgi:IS5 family transposase
MEGPKCDKLHPLDERTTRIIAKVRAKVERPFRILKRQLGHVKARYSGWPRTAPSSSSCSRSTIWFWTGRR